MFSFKKAAKPTLCTKFHHPDGEKQRIACLRPTDYPK